MKPIILGMNNPLSLDPCHALYPEPEGCTGHRLWKMLEKRTGATEEDYMEAFERRNLVAGLAWSRAAAHAAAPAFWEYAKGRTVLVLGSEVREVLGLTRMIVHPIEVGGIVFRQLPHPSGRNPWYRIAGNREVAELLLEELYKNVQLAPREPLLL